MASTHKKQSESKYVSCFADSRPDVDITFRDVLLSRPTDHYLVGVDNFSMTNTSLSMIEPQTGHYDALIRIVRNPNDTVKPRLLAVPATADLLDAELTQGGEATLPDLLYISDNGYDLSIKSTEVILSMQQLMHRLGDLAADVNEYMNTGRAANTFEFDGYQHQAGEDTEHLKFSIATDGRITVRGTRAFWSCFSIEVPAVRNQFGFYGRVQQTDAVVPYTRMRRFMSVHPDYGDVSYNKILVNRFAKPIPKRNVGETDIQLEARRLAVRQYNSRTLAGQRPLCVVVRSTVVGAGNFNRHPQAGGVEAHFIHEVKLGASVFSSLERRIALEVGCSLPIKNSPMVDHQRETPDFVIGRWIWRTDPRIESNEYGGSRRYQSNMPACTEYHGSQDRITYHELQAQSKIQTLRIKLFARLRTFDEVTEQWGMRVIELTTANTDWWHARLHFMSKD